jgi:hypothetical protein
LSGKRDGALVGCFGPDHDVGKQGEKRELQEELWAKDKDSWDAGEEADRVG